MGEGIIRWVGFYSRAFSMQVNDLIFSKNASS